MSKESTRETIMHGDIENHTFVHLLNKYRLWNSQARAQEDSQ